MADSIRQYYWDACLFLEYLGGEPVAPEKRRALARLLQENQNHTNKIFTSVITHVEVLPKKLTATEVENEEKYWGFFDGIWFIDQEVTRPILTLARTIKDYYYKEGDVKIGEHHRIMSTGDAIHLATAIVWKADEFHTRDKNKRGGNVPLLGLPESSPNGKIAGRWALTITSPFDNQGNLLDGLTEANKGSA